MFRKKRKTYSSNILSDVDFVKPNHFNKIEGHIIAECNPSNALDVGTGHDDSDVFSTIDIDSDCAPDFVGDIRCLFALSDHYRDMRNKFPDLDRLEGTVYQTIRLKHVIEHIEWIYLPTLFEWVASMLIVDGRVLIDTPNLEFISRVYVAGLDNQLANRNISFPREEHSDISGNDIRDFQRWINFKIFSGCSPGDYHHACLDSLFLTSLLKAYGFSDIIIYNGSSLRAIASLTKKSSSEMESLIASIKNGG